jgi:Initiator Replication protein
MGLMSNLKPRDHAPPDIKTPQELVHIKHKITLLQYKYWVLMLRTYREAYELEKRELQDGEYCYLSMAKLAEHLGYQPKTSEIERDLEAIRKEAIIYNVLQKDGEKGKTGRGFISEWYVSSNRVGVVLPPVIRRAVENLDNRDSIFHLLNWSVFNSFTGKYEAILYKLCKDYIGATRTPYFPLEEFREYMGVKDSDYPDFKRLNQWVISGPVKRINESELSDISIEPEFKREVRKIIGVWFRVTPKKQTALDFGDDPAFRFAKVSVSLAQQKKYLEAKGGELIELSIQRANEYAGEQERAGKEVNLGALYRKAIEEDWGKEYAEKKARAADKAAGEKKKKTEETLARAQEVDQELRDEFARGKVTAAIKALSAAELQAYADTFTAEEGIDPVRGFDPVKGAFREPAHRAKFTGWLRASVAKKAVQPGDFEAWRSAQLASTVAKI